MVAENPQNSQNQRKDPKHTNATCRRPLDSDTERNIAGHDHNKGSGAPYHTNIPIAHVTPD